MKSCLFAASLKVQIMVVVFLGFMGATVALGQNCENFAVAMSAEIHESTPASITLHWVHDPTATSYTISRRLFAGTDDWAQVATGGASDTVYFDANVQIGVRYEYQVAKLFKGSGTTIFNGYGYIVAGIAIPMVEQMGTVILIVDDSVAPSLTKELAQLQEDLVGDGWRVVRHDVPRNGNVAAIQTLIKNDWNADPSTRSVFLFGHVPVPYSGDIYPDGHPQHHGAWPADAYYGNLQGDWTDNIVEDTVATNKANWNKIGDGKFDQSEPDFPMDLEVGRVDLWGMSVFSLSETELLRQYLNKDHAFRIGTLTAPVRGVICDNFGPIDYSPYAEAFAATAWRSFPAFFGINNTTAIPGGTWFTTLDTAAYLCAYGCGGGDPTDAGGIGSTSDFAKSDSKAIFTSLFGSWFGDWNVPNDFLRAPLCTSYGLTDAWAGRPQWLYHPMALGETIGYCARLTEDSSILYVPDVLNGLLYNAATDGELQCYVSTELMGDPTLKLQYIPPITSFTGKLQSGSLVVLNWQPSQAPHLQGYCVYRAKTSAGPFVRISPTLSVGATQFNDSAALNDSDFYMLRGVSLLTTASGSYFALSQGQTVEVKGAVSGVSNERPAFVASLTAYHSRSGIEIGVANPRETDAQLGIYDVTGREVAKIMSGVLPAGNSQYRWDLQNSFGESSPSGVYFVRLTGTETPLMAKVVLTR